MDAENISKAVFGICTGLVVLAPLVKIVSQWHITLRKMSAPKKEAMPAQPMSSNITQRSGRLALCFMVFELLAYLGAAGYLFYLASAWSPARPASLQDVAFCGILVALMLQNAAGRR